MTSLTNGKGQRKRKERAERDESIDALVVKTLMQTGDGRRWVYIRLWHSGIWYEDGVLDPERMAWKAGLRNEGLRLQASILKVAPELYVRMWQENNKSENEIQLADEADASETEEVNNG